MLKSTQKHLLLDNNLIHSHEINQYTTETNGQTNSKTWQHFALYNSNTVAVNDIIDDNIRSTECELTAVRPTGARSTHITKVRLHFLFGISHIYVYSFIGLTKRKLNKTSKT